MDTDVVVIGSGAAGLAATLWLANRSVRVVVLEGRDRVGGRVLSQSVGSVEVPAELGAEFIHGSAPETAERLRAAGLTQVASSGVSWTCRSAGGLQPVEDDAIAGDLFDRVPLLTEDESVETFLRRFADDPHMREQAQQARAFVEGFEAADPALASVRSVADELRTGTDSTTSRPVGSYAPLFASLAAQCLPSAVDLRLSTIVERIEWKAGDVRVYARSANGDASVFRARCAVVTVPVGVLQQGDAAVRLSFVPPLPPQKQAALRGLEMGHAVRVVLAFRTPFWEHVAEGRYRDAAFFRCEGGAFGAFWTQLPLRGRTIVAWAGGPRATALAGEPAQARIDRARDEFGAMFGRHDLVQREYEAGVTYDWSADPFACGAYSYVATGAGTARAALGTPVDGTLFFAGEATATDGQGGTVSGAFGSGLRAAGEAARALGIASAS